MLSVVSSAGANLLIGAEHMRRFSGQAQWLGMRSINFSNPT